MARTAVVAGTATAVSNRVSRRQANRWAEQDQAQYYEQQQYQQAPPPPPQYVQEAPPPPPAAAPAAAAADPYEQITKLAQMRDAGILTEEEFAAEKAKILAG
jgi:hypothetical protein